MRHRWHAQPVSFYKILISFTSTINCTIAPNLGIECLATRTRTHCAVRQHHFTANRGLQRKHRSSRQGKRKYEFSTLEQMMTLMSLLIVVFSRFSKEAVSSFLRHTFPQVMIPPKGNVIDVLALNSNLTRLVGLLKTAGLADELQGEGPFTIFAPNDEAFSSMRKENLKKLEDNPAMLKTFLRNHVAKGNPVGPSPTQKV